MALSEIDRNLLSRCLDRKPRAWEDFVDRFMGLVVHVIDHSAESRSLRITSADREDMASEVFLALVADDMAVLRRFRGEASLATYLTVITRRVVVQQLLRRRQVNVHEGAGVSQAYVASVASNGASTVQSVQDRDEISRLLSELEGTEAEIVRMYHLEGKSYREISDTVGMPENSIGPTLTRARDKMRRTSVE
ncbi:MAG: sigma-70 family RNA polymerase sigma factor [Pirellulales bacterium]|nr:sigma-70 family RNA polymerase sigma factor [Pirellulales bacterium]